MPFVSARGAQRRRWTSAQSNAAPSRARVQVIYGDTDSIMVNTRTQDRAVCKKLADTIIRKARTPAAR